MPTWQQIADALDDAFTDEVKALYHVAFTNIVIGTDSHPTLDRFEKGLNILLAIHPEIKAILAKAWKPDV